MFKETISYTAFDGKKYTEDFYFHISESDAMQMEMGASQIQLDGQITGGMQEKIERITRSRSGEEIYKLMEDIVFLAYGEKTDDGKGFIKTAERSEYFKSLPAYTQLILKLSRDADYAAKFISGLMPKDLGLTPEKVISDGETYRKELQAQIESETAAAQA